MSQEKTLDIEEIKKLLPHRYPFLLIDKVIDYEPLKMCVAIKNVTYNEKFFQGHFPSQPLMPGVLLIEAMAQTAGIASRLGIEEKEGIVLLVKVDKVKFRRSVQPGDTLLIRSEITNTRPNFHVSKNRIAIKELSGNELLVSEAEIMLSLVLKK